MLKYLADTFAPHYCCSCGEIGAVLCEHCKYNITCESFERCVVCLGPAKPSSNLCSSCRTPYARAWCVGERSDALKAAINLYKYHSTRAAAEIFADLLDETVPILSPQTRVVAVPTITSHIRMRGYDHVERIAQLFAARRGLVVERTLSRTSNLHQQGASRRQRLEQAKCAFHFEPTDPVPHLLVDDVYTTGATLHYAAQALRDAGASEVYIAVLSRQPLEKN